MLPHDQNQDTVQHSQHINVENDGAAWINSAKDRVNSIISNVDSEGTYLRPSLSIADLSTAVREDPCHLKDFYDLEIFTARFGQDSDIVADKRTVKETKYATPTIKEGQQSDSCVCPCCQLPRAPSNSPSTQSSSLLPHLHHTPIDSCCECYYPDIKMPREGQEPLSSTKPHIRRRSSLSIEGLGDCARRQDRDLIQRTELEREKRAEMSVSAWL